MQDFNLAFGVIRLEIVKSAAGIFYTPNSEKLLAWEEVNRSIENRTVAIGRVDAIKKTYYKELRAFGVE